MDLPDDFKAEAAYRSRLADTAPTFKLTVAVVEVHNVSDKDRFLGDFKAYIEKNNYTVPRDKIMRGQESNELYLLLRGTEDECSLKLAKFFDGPGIASMVQDINMIAGVGLSQYEQGKTPLQLVQEAYNRPKFYEIGKVKASSVPAQGSPSIEKLISKEG